MAAKKGSDLVISWAGGTALLSLRTVSWNVNNGDVDITTFGDVDGSGFHWARFLQTVKSLTISGDGVADAQADYDTIMAAALSDAVGAASVITLGNGGTLTGDLLITDIGESGSVAGEITFTLAMKAAGPMAYVAPAP